MKKPPGGRLFSLIVDSGKLTVKVSAEPTDFIMHHQKNVILSGGVAVVEESTHGRSAMQK